MFKNNRESIKNIRTLKSTIREILNQLYSSKGNNSCFLLYEIEIDINICLRTEIFLLLGNLFRIGGTKKIAEVATSMFIDEIL